MLENVLVDVYTQLLSVNLAFFQFQKVNDLIKLPYLDEVFHIPQTQLYCKAALKGESLLEVPWDPKITTPPGLYILGQTYAEYMPRMFLNYLAGENHDPCGTTALRSLNFIGTALVFPAVVTYIQRVRKSDTYLEKQAGTLMPLIMFPLMWFFGFLYYTDVWSTVFVVMSLAVVLVDSNAETDRTMKIMRRAYAAVLSAISVAFRQTNILWAGYIAVTALEEEHRYRIAKMVEKEKVEEEKLNAELNEAISKGKVTEDLKKKVTENKFAKYKKPPTVKYEPKSLAKQIKSAPDFAQFLYTALVTPSITIPFGLVALGFAGFLHENGGIALGDKENHLFTINIAQLFHFALHVVFFTGPFVFVGFHLKPYLAYIGKNPLVTLFSVGAIGAAVFYLTADPHPFTLADNRHFTFYIWRRFIQPSRDSLAFALLIAAPIYHTGFWLLWPREETDLPPTRDVVTGRTIPGTTYARVFYAVAVIGSLVPSPLLEPRYYILPYIIWRARHYRRVENKLQPILEVAWYLIVNLGVSYLFLYRPFEWASEPGVLQRFMW